MPAPSSAEAIRDVNTRYHDVAAVDYDAKWGIDFGEIGGKQVLTKVRKALGGDPPRFRRALEIGSGTGYFSLNLMLAGVIESLVASDISPGMLATLQANATRLGLEVETIAGDSEDLDLPAGSFDLILGHAVLHHLPDLDASFRRFYELLEPGGYVLFAGEPSRYGDRLASVPKRAATAAAPVWRRVIGARPAPAHGHHGPSDHVHANGAPTEHAHTHGHDLEPFVDVHAFAPGELRGLTGRAGFEDVRVIGEELLASWFGWTNRTLEATADPRDVPMGWKRYAYRGYIALQHVDRSLLEGRLPAGAFYNLLLSARKPA
jgi:SAM-dependent methyltransferase